MKSASEFLPRILPMVMGCPIPLATQALVDAAIEFCVESEAIKEDLDAFATAVGQSTYDLDSPQPQQRVEQVVSVKVDGVEIGPAATTSDTHRGRPTAYSVSVLDGVTTLHLFPTPDAAYEIDARATLVPLRSATSFHEQLYERWVEQVCAGTVARLRAIPDQPFSKPDAVVDLAKALSAAKKARSATNAVRSNRVQARPLA